MAFTGMDKNYYKTKNKPTAKFAGGRAFKPASKGVRKDLIYVPKYNSTNINKEFGRVIRKSANHTKSPGFKAERDLLKLNSERIKVNVGGTHYMKVPEAPIKGADGRTVSKTKETVTGTFNPSTMLGRTFKTEFEAGAAPTRSVMMAQRLGGNKKSTYFDTSVAATTAMKTECNLRTGFNRKLYAWFDGISHWTMANLHTLAGTPLTPLSYTNYQKAYWYAKSFGVKYKFFNRNSYLKMKVRVDFIKINESADTPVQYINGAFSTNFNIQDNGAIPINYQLQSPTAGTHRDQVPVHPKLGTLQKSAFFNETCDIVKSFTKWLEPGDIWHLDYNHFMGPGVDLNKLNMYKNEDEFNVLSAPFYYPVFSVVGEECICADSINNEVSYIGTSSGDVTMEFQKYYDIVMAESNASNVYEATGYEKTEWAYRVYTKPTSSFDSETNAAERITNIDYDDIIEAATAAAPGKWFIPVTTETTKTFAGKSSNPYIVE